MPTPHITIRLPRPDHSIVRDIGQRLKREEGFRERLLAFLHDGDADCQRVPKGEQAVVA